MTLAIIILVYTLKKIMLQNPTSIERNFYRSLILNRLTQSCQQFGTVHLFMDQRTSAITARLLSESEIYGTGLTQIHQGDNLEDKDIDKIIVMTVFNDAGRTEIEKYLHLFKQIFIVNLSISGKEITQALKVSPIRKKMKGFLQISLNFIPFIDAVYTANLDRNQEQAVTLEETLTSYLVSLQKFHEFQICYQKSHKLQNFAESIYSKLNEKLQILERHKSNQYKSSSSPRIKVLLLDRNLDKMSPLIYSYHFGAIGKELGQLQNKLEFTVQSPLYSSLFPMDIQEACSFLNKLAVQKAENQKMNFNLNEFEKAKKAITTHYDAKSSPAEIAMHINSIQAIKEFCRKRAETTSLQQSLVNGISTKGEKLTGSKVVSQFQKWSKMPEQFNFSEEDYVKLLILAYMVNSFWFFQRWVINACIPASKKTKIAQFCKRVQGKFKPLKEKEQGEDRFDLYRHQTAFVDKTMMFLKGEQEYQTLNINKSVVNRETRYIIVVNGPLGYNQLCHVLRQARKNPNINLTIFCDRLLTTKEYLQQLLSEKSQ